MLLFVAIGLLVVALICLAVLLARGGPSAAIDFGPLREQLQSEARGGRMELATQLSDQRTELRQLATGSAASLEQVGANLRAAVESLATAQAQALTALDARIGAQTIQQQAATESFRQDMTSRMEALRTSTDQQLSGVRATLEQRVLELQTSNEAKLEQMRITVDEKLQSTLEARIGQSFEQVSKRLEEVHRGLGDMQQLANGVGDLKQVLSNVKTRGTFGELQLESILEQVLTPDQYVKNWAPSTESRERVEFAIRLPSRGGTGDPTFLPIDAKFPQEEYLRLLAAIEAADADGVKASRQALCKQVIGYARYIREKYVAPPLTTDFGIIFLPTEGLFAEVLREPGLIEQLQLEGATLTGPTTLTAVLSALRMGFRTLAIEQRSAEVWRVLGAVRSEFTKFSDVLERMRKQLGTIGTTLEATKTRTRQMVKKLESVETLPAGESSLLLELAPGMQDEEVEDEDA